MNKNNKRPQAQKRINRHDSARLDKGRFAHEFKAPRYSRSTDRAMLLSRNFDTI
jgi:hypothetical protein